MKDTLYIGAFFASVVGFWFYIQSPPAQSLNRNEGDEARNKQYTTTTPAPQATQGNPAGAQKTQKLPPIYSRKQRSKQPSKQTAVKTVHGVPIHQWIEGQKNQLKVGQVPVEQDAGLRLFVQCMEIRKSGGQEVTPAECRKMTARAHGIPTAPVY